MLTAAAAAAHRGLQRYLKLWPKCHQWHFVSWECRPITKTASSDVCPASRGHRVLAGNDSINVALCFHQQNM